jgi:hypothetical protein
MRWTLHNPVTSTTITWPLNPREGALPNREKTYTAMGPTSPYGTQIVFQGRDKPITMSFSGGILEKSHYLFFSNWYDVPNEVTVTDELGNVFTMWLTKFQPKRKNRHSHAWAGEYEIEVLVLGMVVAS